MRKMDLAKKSSIWLLLLSVLLPVEGLSGQLASNRGDASHFLSHQLAGSSTLRQIVGALGERVQSESKGRLQLIGVFQVGSEEPTRASLTWQNPGSVRLQREALGSKVLVLDSDDPQKPQDIPMKDLGMWESIVDDTGEAFLMSLACGDAVRIIGGRFKVPDNSKSSLRGRLFDIYEKTGSLQSQKGVSRAKYYYFDSKTGLPARTSYKLRQSARSVVVVTEFSNWQRLDGQAVPGTIERKEDGVSVFKFTVDTATIGPAVEDATFRVN